MTCEVKEGLQSLVLICLLFFVLFSSWLEDRQLVYQLKHETILSYSYENKKGKVHSSRDRTVVLLSEACTNMLLTLRSINESHHHRADCTTEEPQRQQKWKNEKSKETD